MKFPVLRFRGVKEKKVREFFDIVYTICDYISNFAQDFLETAEDDYEIFVSEYGDRAVVRFMDVWGNNVYVLIRDLVDEFSVEIIGLPEEKIKEVGRREIRLSKEELRRKIIKAFGKKDIDYYADVK